MSRRRRSNSVRKLSRNRAGRRVSASRKMRTSPLALRPPKFLPQATGDSPSSSLTKGNRRTTAAVSSTEPASTTITSSGILVCEATSESRSPTWRSSFRVGMMMLSLLTLSAPGMEILPSRPNGQSATAVQDPDASSSPSASSGNPLRGRSPARRSRGRRSPSSSPPGYLRWEPPSRASLSPIPTIRDAGGESEYKTAPATSEMVRKAHAECTRRRMAFPRRRATKGRVLGADRPSGEYAPARHETMVWDGSIAARIEGG